MFYEYRKSLNIVIAQKEYFPSISTNTTEGQAWKQASLCLSLDCSLWSTITLYVINNMYVKNPEINIDWLIDMVSTTQYVWYEKVAMWDTLEAF